MVFSSRVKSIQKEKANVSEVYSLWDLLVADYQIIDQIKVYENFAHDPDLLLLMYNTLNDLDEKIKDVLKKMKTYSIKSVDAPRAYVHTTVNTEVIYDEQIALWLLLISQERLEMKLRAIRNSVTSDSIRKFFMKLIKSEISSVNTLFKYMKLKGWINQPPIYPNIPVESSEVLDVGEAFHLWDHLTFRYDNIEQTELFHAFAHDGDFKLLLKQGLQNTLKKQATMLEKELYKFGLSLPKKPPESTKRYQDLEILDDEYMYRILLLGVQGAAVLHAQAFKQSVTNDRIRGIFADLLWSEIDQTDSIIKYGKVKGYFNQVPLYSQ
ncbi:MAG: DUF3231 family protein [Eubacteriales bacterium]